MDQSNDKTQSEQSHDENAADKTTVTKVVEKTVEMSSEKLDEVAGQVDKAAQKVDDVAKKALTLLWDELPSWMRDNQYIRTGYRAPSNSFYKSLSSVGALHNETVNIWTHMLAALSFFPITWFLYTQVKPRYELAQSVDVAVFCCFFVGVGLCLAISATYHAISNHSQRIARIGNRFDYIGIVFDIWGSFIPCLYYGLIPVPTHVTVYWTMITVVGAITLMAVSIPKFSTPDWRVFRTATFVAMGLSGLVPVVHGLSIYGAAQLERQMSLSWTLAQGAIYIFGGCIYAARVPERWWPGCFDIFGSSHQIFHVLIVIAGMVHLTGLLKAFDYNHSVRMGLL